MALVFRSWRRNRALSPVLGRRVPMRRSHPWGVPAAMRLCTRDTPRTMERHGLDRYAPEGEARRGLSRGKRATCGYATTPPIATSAAECSRRFPHALDDPDGCVENQEKQHNTHEEL